MSSLFDDIIRFVTIGAPNLFLILTTFAALFAMARLARDATGGVGKAIKSLGALIAELFIGGKDDATPRTREVPFPSTFPNTRPPPPGAAGGPKEVERERYSELPKRRTVSPPAARRSVDWHLGMQVVISTALLIAALYIILSKQYTDADTKWSYGIIGTVIGYWLKGK